LAEAQFKIAPESLCVAAFETRPPSTFAELKVAKQTFANLIQAISRCVFSYATNA